MKTISVQSDALASILLLEKDLEPTPEPFRMQPNVCVLVDFQEYINFCTHSLGSLDFLATPSSEIHKFIRLYQQGKEEGHKGLWSAFLKDVAFAAMKELYFAESFGKGASTIVHYVAGCENYFSDEKVDKFYANVRERVLPELLARFSCKGYVYPAEISPQNVKLFKYAVVAYYLSDHDFTWLYT